MAEVGGNAALVNVPYPDYPFVVVYKIVADMTMQPESPYTVEVHDKMNGVVVGANGYPASDTDGGFIVVRR